MTVLNLLIADDHEFTRIGLKYALQENPRFHILDSVDNGEKAVATAAALNPDVILMDISMPLMDGITATQKIKAANPDIKIVMLTSRQVGEEIFASLAAKADAYCLKDINTDRLMQVIDMVAEGGIWLDPPIAAIVMGNLAGETPGRSMFGAESKPAKTAVNRQAYNTELTDREMDVLALIVAGKSNKEIADELTITINTVKVHVGNIIQKLAVDDRTQVAVKALQEGLV